MQIFHVGYPKSGSTTIQEMLAADPAINFLGKPYRSKDAEYLVREYLPFSDLRQLPNSALERLRAVVCEGHPIVSEEVLSGVGFAHGLAANSLLQILDNLDVLTNGEFVAHLVLRQPASFLRSYYGQLVRMGARMRFDQFCSLVMLRRHHWVFRALNFRAILNSKYSKDGRLKTVLFESLFHDKGLNAFLRSSFNLETVPESPESKKHNSSDTDSVIDYLGPRTPANPTAMIELQVIEPSAQEHHWINRMPPDESKWHSGLWTENRQRAFAMFSEMVDLQKEVRRALARHRGNRPVSPIFRQLVAEVAQVNEGLDHDFPDLGFARHRYFDPSRAWRRAALPSDSSEHAPGLIRSDIAR